MHTFSYCKVMFCTKYGSKIGNEYHICSTCGHKTRFELTQFHYSFKTQFVRKISFGITFKLDIITKLLLCSFIYTKTLISVKERSNVNLVIMVFEGENFLMLKSTN